MSKSCPIYGKAIYVDCQECVDKPCKCGNIMKLKHNERLVKGDFVSASIGNKYYYYMYMGKRNGIRVLYNILDNEEIEVGERYFTRFDGVKVN